MKLAFFSASLTFAFCPFPSNNISLCCNLSWSFLARQEYRVFGLTRAGEDPEEGEREKTEKVR